MLEHMVLISKLYISLLDNAPTYLVGYVIQKRLSYYIGWVTPARHQQSCGSCAAFATGGAMEICLARAKAPTAITGLDISEQQLVDCAYDGNGANGCHGAWLSAYPKFIAGN